MRIGGLALIALIAACGGGSSGSGAGGAGGALTGASSSGSGGEMMTSSTSSGMACAPGQQVACACPGGEQGVQVCLDDGSGYGPCTGCAGQGGSGGGPQPECQIANDCRGQDTECATRTCIDTVCGWQYAAAGTVLASQTAGDCATIVCDGSGSFTFELDASDVPNDANECTSDECNMGSPVNAPLPTGTVCSAGLCDSTAACVSHIPVMCDTPAGVYVSCDGIDHSQMYTVFYDTPNGMTPCYPFAPYDVGYCVPGSQCSVDVFSGFHYGTCL